MSLLNVKLAVAAALASPIFYSATLLSPPMGAVREPQMIELKAGNVTYRPAGDFARAGKPVAAPFKIVRFERLMVMKHQVTVGEYRRCIEEAGCPSLGLDVQTDPDEPVVGVSWRDAQDYATWLSRKTGRRYRLPTDEEWAFAAGSRFHDEGWTEVENNDPARRWLARYEQASAQAPIDRTPRAIGAFGANENGLLDVAGNVWEWSNTCFVRVALHATNEPAAETTNCGVRVVQGRHRTYVTDFIRDARSGGCSVGAPPANLGFRLVRER